MDNKKSLKLESFLSESFNGLKSVVALIKIGEYLSFLKNSEERIDENIFESNVRDFQGYRGEVNSAIQKTLSNKTKNDFWWLNNGITILVNNFEFHSKTVYLTNPQVINGLQTSYSILNQIQQINWLTQNEKF